MVSLSSGHRRRYGVAAMGSHTKTKPQVAAAAALVALALAGACGTDDDDGTTGASADELHGMAASLCRKDASCDGRDSAWIEACVGEADDQIAAAEGYGCLDIMATWFTCLVDSSICTRERGYTDHGACADQEELAEDCRNGRL